MTAEPEGSTNAMPGRAKFVLDGSVTLAWYFQDESNDYADAVRAGMDRNRPIVPAIWPLEVANAILMGERRGRSSRSQAEEWSCQASADRAAAWSA